MKQLGQGIKYVYKNSSVEDFATFDPRKLERSQADYYQFYLEILGIFKQISPVPTRRLIYVIQTEELRRGLKELAKPQSNYQKVYFCLKTFVAEILSKNGKDGKQKKAALRT